MAQAGEVVRSVLLVSAFVCGVSCDNPPSPRVTDPETQPTQISYNLISTESKDGKRSYRMQTPLMERYELAKEPFSEFRKGIHVITYNDSTNVIESELTAKYARLDEIKEVWEARGDVVGRNHTGDRTVFTEQLFWDQKADKIYTDKVAKVLDGKSTHYGTGFEADGGFTVWTFRKPYGQMEMRSDSTSSDSTANPEAGSEQTATGDYNPDGLPVYSATPKKSDQMMERAAKQNKVLRTSGDSPSQVRRIDRKGQNRLPKEPQSNTIPANRK